MGSAGRQIFHIVMIKPTHYDDDGYPIQWYKSLMPSNTLAVINGLVDDCAAREVLGPDVAFKTTTIDETNLRVRPDRMIRKVKADGGKAFIMLVGVQSNQFPRAVDLAQPFMKAGIPVAIGGFHVSGCLSMLDEQPPEIEAAKAQGITLFAGEAEDGRMEMLLKDAWNGELKPLYDFMSDLPDLQGQPIPFLDQTTIGNTQADFSSFDLGRGCPYQCSFCTIINVQGRKSRFRSADDLEAIVRANAAQGVYKFFVTDDDLARNKMWESYFDRLIELRAQGFPVKLTIQVDMLVHKIDGFIEKACKAGVERVFFGLENINPDNLLAANKRQNKITEYRSMFLKWRSYGATILAGYILGFPNDRPETILRDVEIVKNELPIDILEFFFLTPLPGSADHQKLVKDGVWMDDDPNKFDTFHRVTHHQTMSDAEWEAVYSQAWHSYYTPEHIERIGRRAAAQEPRGVKVDEVTEFYLAFKVEGVHPLESGVLRRKYRRDRRSGLPLENPMLFYPRYWAETVRKMAQYGWGLWQANRLHKRIMADPDRLNYRDVATTPVTTDEIETLEMFRETSGSAAAIRRQKVIEKSAEQVLSKSA